MLKLEKELEKRGNDLTRDMPTESELEKEFCYYLAESREQQPFIFYKLDEKGDVAESVQMFTEKKTDEESRREKQSMRESSSEAFKSLLSVDVEKQLCEWEEEKKRKVMEEMDRLEEAYEQALQKHNNGEEGSPIDGTPKGPEGVPQLAS